MASTTKSQDRWDGLERLLYDYSLTELLEAAQNNPSRLIMAELHSDYLWRSNGGQRWMSLVGSKETWISLPSYIWASLPAGFKQAL
jgi:hypothetical protein